MGHVGPAPAGLLGTELRRKAQAAAVHQPVAFSVCQSLRRRLSSRELHFTPKLIVTGASAKVSTPPPCQELSSRRAKLSLLAASSLTTWIFRSMERRMW